MGELTYRAYQPGDAGAVTDLYNEIDVRAGGEATFTATDMASLLKTTVGDPEKDSKLVLAPDGTLVGAAFVPTVPAGGFRCDIEGGVHPDWVGRGIGRELLGYQIERAGQLRAEIAPDAVWEVHASSILSDEAALRLYQRFGLTVGRYWFEMVAPLTGELEALPLADGLTVEGYRPEFEERVYDAHMDSFRDHWGYQKRPLEQWREVTVRSGGFFKDHSVLAVAPDGEVAGYVLCYDDPNPNRLYVGHVGTRRAYRKRGVAAALLSESMRRGAAAGFVDASLGVDAASPTGANGLYERVGFRNTHRSVTYIKEV